MAEHRPVAGQLLNKAAATRVRKELRARVDGELVLKRIEHIMDLLLAGTESVRDPSTGLMLVLPIDSTRTQHLKVVLDAQFKLLGKVLPDLRAIELTGEDGEPLTAPGQADNLVLATKLLALMRNTDAHDTDSATPISWGGSTSGW